MFVKTKSVLIFHAHEFVEKYWLYTKEPLSQASQKTKQGNYRTNFDPYDDTIVEYFDIYGWVIYDTGIWGAPREWYLEISDDLWNDRVMLRGANYPGWHFVDRGESTKEITFQECKGQFLTKKVFIQNGKQRCSGGSNRIHKKQADRRNYWLCGRIRYLCRHDGSGNRGEVPAIPFWVGREHPIPAVRCATESARRCMQCFWNARNK